MSDHDDPTHVGQALLRLIEAGAAPHVRVRERDVEVIISVPSFGMDGGRRRRASTTAPTVGRALARARVRAGVPTEAKLTRRFSKATLDGLFTELEREADAQLAAEQGEE